MRWLNTTVYSSTIREDRTRNDAVRRIPTQVKSRSVQKQLTPVACRRQLVERLGRCLLLHDHLPNDTLALQHRLRAAYEDSRQIQIPRAPRSLCKTASANKHQATPTKRTAAT